MKVRNLAVAILIGLTAVAESARASEQYYALYMGGKKIGHAVRSREAAGGKVTHVEEVSITLSRGEMPVAVRQVEKSIETPEGKPLGFESVQDMGIMAMHVTGRVNDAGKFIVTMESMGSKQESVIDWPSGAMMAEGLRLLTEKKGLKEGVAFSAKIFSPMLMQAIDANVAVGAKEEVDLLGRVVSLHKVTTTLNVPNAGVMAITSYVDEQLEEQKVITPVMGMQIEMVACTKEFALSPNDVVDVLNKLSLASPQPIENISSAKSITYYLKPLAGANDIRIPSTDNQSVRVEKDGTIVVTVAPVAAAKGVRFPYRGTDEKVLTSLKPTQYVQSDRKEIIELARKAVGSTKDAAEAVRRIEAFVAQYIENKSLTVGYASAAEVAASRKGDCSEFSVLTAALCRAAGIPAQVVAGVAYIDEFLDLKTIFGGHAWVQAYVGDKWVGVDSTFKSSGRGGYDAGHIALAVGEGDPADFFGMVSSLGKFRIEKITVSMK